MERIFSVEEIADPFWSSSSSPHSAAGSSDPKAAAINRCPSEWAFQKFLQEAVPENPSPSVVSTAAANPNLRSSASSGRRREKGCAEDELAETKGSLPLPPAVVPPPVRDGGPPVKSIPVDSDQYPEYLKQQLNRECAAVAVARSRVISSKAQDSVSLVVPKSHTPESSKTGIQTPVIESGSSSSIQDKVASRPTAVPASPAVLSATGQTKPTTSGSSRELSDDDEVEGETEGMEDMDPADAKRFRR